MEHEEEGLEEAIRYCGTPLQPYDEDSFPSRKKIGIEEQVVKDAQGRQRFHGAFTGGFSAGFFNTVGSLEGWNPREFKSSRQDKADGVLQKPEDFMDEEDVGVFGIAPRRIKAKIEYAVKEASQKIQPELSGLIPGESILKTIINDSRERMGDILIRNVNYSERIRKHQELASQMRMYGCVMPLLREIPESIENKEYKVPDLFKQNLEKPKSNTSGLGHLNLEGLHTAKVTPQNSFVVKDVNDKTLTIRGHAFGVGAFEQEDEDIYSREDMSNYDFELTKEKEVVNETVAGDDSILELDLFVSAIRSLMVTDKRKHLPPVIDQRGGHSSRARKSRFEPLKMEMDDRTSKPVDSPEITKPKGGLDPIIRARYLGEHVPDNITSSKDSYSKDSSNRSKDHNSKDSCTMSVESAGPSNLGFGVDFTDRFVSSTASENVHDILAEVKPTETEHGTEEMRAAARMKMFGDLTRQNVDWRPSPLLCKRFNIAEPLTEESGLSSTKRKSTREVIFYLEENNAEEVIDTESVQVKVTQKKIKLEEAEDIEDVVTGNMDNPVEHEVKEEKVKNMDNPLVDVVDKIGVEEHTDMYKSVFCDSSESEAEEDNEETNAKVSKNGLLLNAMDLFSSENIKHPFGQTVAETVIQGSGEKVTKIDTTMEEELTPTDSLKSETLAPPLDNSFYGPALPPKKSDHNPNIGNAVNHTLEPEDNGYEWIEKEMLRKWNKDHKKEKKRRTKSAKSRRKTKNININKD